MRYHDYTYNTGNHTIHDTDASIDASVIPALSGLLAAGSGIVPGAGRVRYRITMEDRRAALHVEIDGNPIWMALIYMSEETGSEALSLMGEIGDRMGIAARLNRLAYPGLITLLFPAGMAAIDRETILTLADFARCMAGIILIGGCNEQM